MSQHITHTDYETVIGLEVHAQLLTRSKLFCGCSTSFGATPNQHTCEVCLGMPGVLPVPNQHAISLAIRAAVGLECTVHNVSQWSRKNYFYPDLAKGYQISQYDRPIATQGRLIIDTHGITKTIGITRIHMEEDAGKSVHDPALAGDQSYVDFNRAGVPLVEIVSEPDLRSSDEAVAYLKSLRQILRYLGVCDGNMEEGSLRCDANVSVRPMGQKEFGTRVELKNINSFRFVQQAIDYEVLRHISIVSAGGQIEQETRLFDPDAKVTRTMRKKEDAHDYRYFPDPDLPNLIVSSHTVEQVRGSIPELPRAKRLRYTETWGITADDAAILTEDDAVAHFFDQAVQHHHNAKAIANWIIHALLAEIKDCALSDIAVTPITLAELVTLIDQNTISGKIAKDVFNEMLAHGGSPKAIVEAKGWLQVSDEGALLPMIEQVLNSNPQSVESYRAGKTNAVGFLVGQVMKASGGKANPQLVSTLIRNKLQQSE